MATSGNAVHLLCSSILYLQVSEGLCSRRDYGHRLGREDEDQAVARTVTCASTQEPVRCDQSNFLQQSYPPHSERGKETR